MDERQDARHSIEDARERLNQLTDELADRVNPHALKEKAKLRGRMFVSDTRERATVAVKRHPAGTASVVGGFIAFVVGATLLARRRRAHRRELLARERADQAAETARLLASDVALALRTKVGQGSLASLARGGYDVVRQRGGQLVTWAGDRSRGDLIIMLAAGLGLGGLFLLPSLLRRRAERRSHYVTAHEIATPGGETIYHD